MKSPKHKPDPMLKKSHAHVSKKDYKRPTPSQENTWRDEAEGCPHLNEVDWDKLPDQSGGVK